MKKFIVSGVVVLAATGIQLTHASSDIELKRSCLKENPLAAGESDQELLGVYEKLCDKKNKDNKNSYLVLVAQKFQQLGKNYKALSIVNQLEAQNIRSNTLTDVKFLAGMGLADGALNTMRTTEMRYLSEDSTYPAAKKFSESVKAATPSAILVEKQEPVAKQPVYNTSKPTRVKPPVTTHSKAKTVTAKPKAEAKPAQKPAPQSSAPKNRPTPFGNL